MPLRAGSPLAYKVLLDARISLSRMTGKRNVFFRSVALRDHGGKVYVRRTSLSVARFGQLPDSTDWEVRRTLLFALLVVLF